MSSYSRDINYGTAIAFKFCSLCHCPPACVLYIGQDPLWFPTTAPKWKTPDGFLHLLLGYTRCYSAGETFALPATTTERTLMGLVFVDGASCAATIYRPGRTVVDMLDGQIAWTDRSFSYQGVPLGMSMGRLQQGPHLLPSGTVLRADITGNATRVFVFFSADATKDGGLYNSLVLDPAWSGELQNKPQWHDGSTLHNMRGFSRCYPSRSQLVLPATTTAQAIVGVVIKDVTDRSCDRMCPAGYAYVPGAAFSPQFLDGMTKETQAECAEWCTSYGSLCQASFWTPSSLDCTLSMSVLLPQPDPSVIKSPFEFIPCAKANLSELPAASLSGASLVEGAKAIPGPIADQCRSFSEVTGAEDEPPDLLSEEEDSDEDELPGLTSRDDVTDDDADEDRPGLVRLCVASKSDGDEIPGTNTPGNLPVQR
eukprot:g51229.t1